jgi:uroporphyrinogen decarboxylase
VIAAPLHDRFLRACRSEPVDRTPVWFMRQAGRYLPEYRELRGDRDILETCKDPGQVVEITLQPLRRMDVDAAILFGDIMVPLASIGIPVRIDPGIGPVVDPPIRSAADVARLRPLEPDADVPFVLEAISLLRKELDRPLIGFSGAPFTLASYLVEGGPSRNHAHTKALMLGDPETWGSLMRALTSIVVPYLRAQVAAGAQALQVFDSWVGSLDPDDYERSVLLHSRAVFEGLADLDVPMIHFGVGTGDLLPLLRRAGGTVIGVDWKTSLDTAWARLGGPDTTAVQGNLDPAALLGPWGPLERKTRDVLARAAGRDGHIFNLGHGVLPETDPDALRRIVDLVHASTERATTSVATTEPAGAGDR